MIRSELIETLTAEYPHLTPEQLDAAVRLFFGDITEQLARGGRVELRGFGVFEIRTRAERMGRNPKNGKQIPVPAKLAVHFKTGKAIRNRLKGQGNKT